MEAGDTGSQAGGSSSGLGEGGGGAWQLTPHRLGDLLWGVVAVAGAPGAHAAAAAGSEPGAPPGAAWLSLGDAWAGAEVPGAGSASQHGRGGAGGRAGRGAALLLCEPGAGEGLWGWGWGADEAEGAEGSGDLAWRAQGWQGSGGAPGPAAAQVAAVAGGGWPARAAHGWGAEPVEGAGAAETAQGLGAAAAAVSGPLLGRATPGDLVRIVQARGGCAWGVAARAGVSWAWACVRVRVRRATSTVAECPLC